ncbi:MAG: asparagine synthase (glutamine-hydrolyzing) [Myxococcales bacterium]|nr:asparagine synthase (glutamine-hydrolyzing) [Myxococcales bacterium]
MGGLAGWVRFGGPTVDDEVVADMALALAHRGPDAHGQWSDEGASLAHRCRRVRSVALTQPCVADDLVVLLDGWVYDHEALGSEVGAHAGATDTEVLLHAWRRWQEGALSRLEGEFAVAVWDRQRRQLTLARDRMGTRPLYYGHTDGQVAFASELPALLKVPWIERTLDRTRLAEYLSFQVVHAPRTLLKGVLQLEPGCWVQHAEGGRRTTRYWQPRYAPPGTARPSDGEVVDRLQEAVSAAVHRRVPAGVDTGQFLSGGLGSAAIAMAARSRGVALPGFTVSFTDDPYPEAPFAGRVASLLGVELHEVVVGTAELADSFDDAVAALGHPVGHPAVLMQLALAREARQHVRVVLSGNGGESLFGGRQIDGLARDLRLAGLLQHVPSPLASSARRLLNQTRWGRRAATRLSSYALDLGIGGADLFSTEERERLLSDPSWVKPHVRREVLEPLYADLDTDPINVALHGTLRSSLIERALPRMDRTAAATGLDVRFPLLDTAVVAAATALPGTAKIRRVAGSLHTRWPLRAMLQGQLPAVLVDRPKRGLPTPLGTWLAGPGRLFMEERVRRLKEDPNGLWNADAIDGLRRDVRRSNAAGIRLWTLFILDAWCRTL